MARPRKDSPEAKAKRQAEFLLVAQRIARDVQRHWEIWRKPLFYRTLVPRYSRYLPKGYYNEFREFLMNSPEFVYIATGEKHGTQYVFPALEPNGIQFDEIMAILKELDSVPQKQKRGNPFAASRG